MCPPPVYPQTSCAATRELGHSMYSSNIQQDFDNCPRFPDALYQWKTVMISFVLTEPEELDFWISFNLLQPRVEESKFLILQPA